MKTLKTLSVLALLAISAGCCITSRCWKIDRTIEDHVLSSGGYREYTNGVETVYKYCSNAVGPFEDWDVYPATRNVLNHLSLMSYSSPASGDYMLNMFNLPFYPIILCELPVQIVLDTVLLPWDWITAPTTPEGFKRVN